MTRTIEGDALVHHLTEAERMIDADLLARHGRSARTLVKEGPLRLMLVALTAGGVMPTHSAEGPVTVHLIEGAVTVSARGVEYPLKVNDVLVIAAGVEHDVKSDVGGVFLLTVVFLGRAEAEQPGAS